MKGFLAAVVILVIPGASAVAEPSCRQSDDSGKAVCVAGVLYRCACRDVSGATVCSWDNAASACSALSAQKGEPAPVRESRLE
ncbi:MAG TPA: hypothetical protein VIG55_13835 [Methylosinus sp.]|jgi:hypothetical protein